MSFVRWDNKPESDRLSPWDLEPIDENRRPNSVNLLPVLPSEIVATMYRPRPEDWGGERDSECDRISAELSQVMKLAIAEPFVSLVDLNLCPYPIDISTIKARLDNRFYRRASAVEFDVNYIYTNARMFNQPESDIVRSASIITKTCMKIIRKNTAVAKYEMRVEGTDGTAGGPSTSRSGAKRNGTTSNIGSRSRRNSQPTESECLEIIANRDAFDVPTIYQRVTTTPSHTGKKPHQCRICKRQFNQLGNLERHLQTHNGEKPLNCHLCRKSFTDTSSHKKHLRLHGEEKTTNCVPSSPEELTPTDSNGSDVEGNNLIVKLSQKL